MATDSLNSQDGVLKKEEPEDDDAWLYGEDAAGEETAGTTATTGDHDHPDAAFDPNEEDYLQGNEDEVFQEESNVDQRPQGDEEEGEEDDEEEDDDDDDDIQVTIGEISSTPAQNPYGAAPVNINIAKRTPGLTTTATGAASKAKTNAVDLDVEGTFNGESIFDLNPDSLDDKPWRKPGADITDYFNYGFTEETWRSYCDRQRRMRCEASGTPVMQGMMLMPPPNRPPFMGHPRGPPPPMGYHRPPGNYMPHHAGPPPEQTISTVNSLVNENSKYSSPVPGMMMNRPPFMRGPPPMGRRPPGSVDVLGSGPPPRRPDGTQENFIQVLGPRPGPNNPPTRYGPPPGHPNGPLPHHYVPGYPPPGMDGGYYQGMPPHNGNYGGDCGHNTPPRFSHPPSPGRRYDDERGYGDDPPDDRDYYRESRDPPPDRYSNDRYSREDDYRGRSTYEERRHESPTDDRGFRGEEGSRNREEPSREVSVKEEETEETSRSSSSRHRSSHHRSSERTESSSSSHHREKSRDKDSDRNDSSSKRRHRDDDKSSSRHKHSKRSRRDKDDD